jgi:hypothetical protein
MQKQIHKNKSQHSGQNTTARKARTRTLIQLGGLIEKSGLMKSFDLEPGDDLQKDLEKKENVFALLGALLEINTMIKNEDIHPHLLAQKGATFFNEIEK